MEQESVFICVDRWFEMPFPVIVQTEAALILLSQFTYAVQGLVAEVEFRLK